MKYTKQEVKTIGMKAYDLLYELKDLCYADGLDEFDALHDDLHYQIQGLYYSLCDAEEDDWDEGYIKEFGEALALANNIKDYREQLLKLSNKDFNWIYC
jgi:hypothetical protein